MTRRTLVAPPTWLLLPAVLILGITTGISTDAAIAQDAPPGTDVYLAQIETGTDGDAALAELRNVTDRDGYDNQPSFSTDGGTIFYTSIRANADGSGQADIYAYELTSGTSHQVTDTATSEYSPTQIPGDDAISVVRVESDGETQRLWRFPLDADDKAGEPSLILEKIQPVGYHAWLVDGQRKELVLFVLDDPHRLVRTAAKLDADGRTVASDIGRALHRIPGENAFSFVRKSGETGR